MMTRWLRQHTASDEGSLILVVGTMLFVMSLLSVLTATIITGTYKSRYNKDFVIAGLASDQAVQNALVTANLQKPITVNQNVFGAGAAGTWVWHAELTPRALLGTSFDIIATGTSGKTSRSVRATITGINAAAASILPSGALSYTPTPGTGFIAGVFTDVSTVMRGGSVIDSYDSGNGTLGTGHGSLASNGTLDLAGLSTSSVDSIGLFNFSELPYTDRCVGPPCALRTGTRPPKFDVNSAPATKFIIDAINVCQNTSHKALVPWIASKAATPGILTAPPTGACYSSLVFDMDTSVLGTTASPTKIYVSGSITLGPGVRVNASAAAPTAPALQIYSIGPAVTFDGSGLSGPTFGGGMWAPNADCATSASDRPATVYGSIVCSRLSGTGVWAIHYDDQFANGASTTSGPVIWDLTKIDLNQ